MPTKMNERTNTMTPLCNGKPPTFSPQEHPGSSKNRNTSGLFEGKTPVFSSTITTKKPFSSASLFHGTTPTFLPQDHPRSSKPPNPSRLFQGKTPIFFNSTFTTKVPHFSSAPSSHSTTPTFLPHGSNTLSRPANPPRPPNQHPNPPHNQLKLVTLTFTCRHRRFLSQLGAGRLRDHVDVASMLRSVHPTVTPLIAEHYPDAECPSCRRVRVSRGKKVRFGEEGDSDEGASEYDTADEGDDDEEEGFEGKKVLLRW